MSDKERLDFLTGWLSVSWDFDCHHDFFWRVDDGKARVFAICNDFFAWGCADLEEILPADLPDLRRAMEDACAAYKPGSLSGGCMYGTELWCARKRKMRPQGACYKGWEPAIAALFDACGPHRPTGIGNPYPNDPERGKQA